MAFRTLGSNCVAATLAAPPAEGITEVLEARFVAERRAPTQRMFPRARGASLRAMAAHLRDQLKLAATSVGPRRSRLATWSAALCEWHGAVVARIPVEPQDIMCVAAVLKARGCRSFFNYLSDVKDEHTRLATSGPSVWRKRPGAAIGRSRGAWVRRGSRSHCALLRGAHPCHVMIHGTPRQFPFAPLVSCCGRSNLYSAG